MLEATEGGGEQATATRRNRQFKYLLFMWRHEKASGMLICSIINFPLEFAVQGMLSDQYLC
jgi:hypothetical protein